MAAYEVLLLNTAVPQIQAAQSGDTYVVPRDIAFSAALTLSAGTANGVPYLNGSKVVTTGSALTFDGTNLGVTGNAAAVIQSSVRNDSTATNAGAKLATFYSATEITSLGHYWDGGQFLGRLNSLSDLIFARNNSEQMRLTSTGLGIGTSSPEQKLDVYAASGTIRSAVRSGTSFLSTFTSSVLADGSGIFVNAGSSLSFAHANTSSGSGYTERMRLDASGNLGLGVTPSAWNSSYRALQVGGSGISAWTTSSSGGNLYLSNNVYFDGSNRRYIANAVATEYEAGTVGHVWKTAPSGTAGNAITFTQAMTLDASGNLGVGTASPGAAYRLHLSNTGADAIAQINTGLSTGYAYLRAENSSSFIYSTGMGSSSGAAAPFANNGGFVYTNGTGGLSLISANDSAPMVFSTSNTERARITSVGNFKIGGTADRATTEGTNQLVLFNGTAPVGTLTNGVSFYSASGEARVMDAAGNSTLLSPHDQSTNEWIFHSKHTPTGKVLRIDVERLLKFVNDHFGLDAVHEFIEE